jgi:hypothetical protein
MMTFARRLQVDAAVLQALSIQTFTKSYIAQQRHGGMFQNAGPDTRQNVILRTGLDDHRVDTICGQ